MAIRKIEFEVSEGAISPSEKVFGGMQNEHNATELVFVLSDSLKNKLKETYSGILYRFDAYNMLGKVYSTEPKLVTEEPMVFALENRLTSAGGSIRVYLVISESSGEDTLLDLYSFPAELFLEDLPDGKVYGGENMPSITTLYEEVKNSAKAVKEVADEILNSDIFLKKLCECISDPEVTLHSINADSYNPIASAAVASIMSELEGSMEDIAVRAAWEGSTPFDYLPGWIVQDYITDQVYNPDSAKPQSGAAVSQAIAQSLGQISDVLATVVRGGDE